MYLTKSARASILPPRAKLYFLLSIASNPIEINDVISEIDYSDAIDYHESHKADATMVVNRFETQNPYGVIETDGNIFRSYEEKPIKHENINTGIYIFNSEVFKYIEEEKYLDMPDLFTKLSNLKKKVIVYPIYEKWQDLGHKKNFKK